MKDHPNSPMIQVLTPTRWREYTLLDSGNGLRLEQVGAYRFIRPAAQAVWKPALPKQSWKSVDGIFEASASESGGRWRFYKQNIPSEWILHYQDLRFKAFTASSRHIGFFPEQAPHWDWMTELLQRSPGSVQVLNLFGYTGLASLSASSAGAVVTHVDASKKIIQIAKENQTLCGLSEQPIRWILDDALKFLQREVRRGRKYDAIILDPPKFGRGPKGEVWEFFQLLPNLLDLCSQVLSQSPLFIVMTAYAIQASPLSLYYALQSIIESKGGTLSCGELALTEQSAGRLLPMAIFARWEAQH